MEIHVKAKKAYGLVRYYPVNEAAKAIAKIAKADTLTEENLWHCKHMGCILKVQLENIIVHDLPGGLFHSGV